MFDDVSFRYGPNLAGVFDLSFVVAAGKTVAFVGPSGSGKSTTARLACRLYDVAGGSVRVGGIDIRGVKQASLRRLTAVVAQETVLFNESVAFNIGYGLEGDDRERVVQAAKRAQLHCCYGVARTSGPGLGEDTARRRFIGGGRVPRFS